jgi:hypothetical protein
MNICTLFDIANSPINITKDGLYLLLHLFVQSTLLLLLGNVSRYDQTVG